MVESLYINEGCLFVQHYSEADDDIGHEKVLEFQDGDQGVITAGEKLAVCQSRDVVAYPEYPSGEIIV